MSTERQLLHPEVEPGAPATPVPVAAPHLARAKTLFQLSLLGADLVGAAAAVLVASRLEAVAPRLLSEWLSHLSLVPCWLLVLFLGGYYTLRPARPMFVWAGQLAGATVGGTALAISLNFLLRPDALAARNEYIIAGVLAWFLFLVVRAAGRRLGPPALVSERVLVLGTEQRARALVEALMNGHNRQGAELVGAVMLDGVASGQLLCPVLGDLQQCADLIREKQINHLVIAPAAPLPNDLVYFAAHCDSIGIRVQSMETAYEELTWRAPIFNVGAAWQAGLESVNSSKYGTRLKRVADLVFTIALMPAALTIMGLSALLIKLFSPGPVFYHQERIGKDGVPFTFSKLRTMVVDAEKDTGPVWATDKDPRITGVGNFLRKTRLDEVPQLFSVLRGHMSLIGPRPERAHFVEQFKREIPLYEKRLMVRPGITGWAQIHHSYDRSTDDVVEKLRYDLYYIRHLSFALDLQIIVKTIGVMLGKKGAH